MVQQGWDWVAAIVCHYYIKETVCKTKSKKNRSIHTAKHEANVKLLIFLIKGKKHRTVDHNNKENKITPTI